MAQPTPQVYEITLFDAEQQVMTECHMQYPLPESWDHETAVDRQEEREMHFLAIQQGAGASAYETHLMRPREVKKLQRQLNREAFVDLFTAKMSKVIGLDKYIELIPVMVAMDKAEQSDQRNLGSGAHFART